MIDLTGTAGGSPLDWVEGWVVADSRGNCTPRGWYKVWTPGLHYSGVFDKALAGVGMNIGGLKPSEYLKIIANCDVYQVLTSTTGMARRSFDPDKAETFTGVDTPDIDLSPKVVTVDGQLQISSGIDWKPIGDISHNPYQSGENNLCIVNTLSVQGGTSPANYSHYEVGEFVDIPIGTHVTVNPKTHFIVGGHHRKYSPDPLVRVEVNDSSVKP